MQTPKLPRTLYPVHKGLLFAADGSAWSVLEEERGERVARLDPAAARVDGDAGVTQVASFELLLMSLN